MVAVPSAVAYCTVTGVAEAWLSNRLKLNVLVPLLPSFWDTSEIEMLGRVTDPSSLVMVPTPWLSKIVALLGLVRLTTNFSSLSDLVSPLTSTVTCWLVTPGAKVSVPLLAV